MASCCFPKEHCPLKPVFNLSSYDHQNTVPNHEYMDNQSIVLGSVDYSKTATTNVNLQYTRYVLAILIISIILISTYVRSTITFQKTVQGHNFKKPLPKVPYWTPFFCHVFSLMRNPAGFVDDLMKRCGYRFPIEVQAGTLKLCLISNPAHIQTIFKDSKILSSKPSTIYVLKNMFATPASVIPYYAADDSGMGAKIRKGSTVKQENRMHFWAAHAAQTHLSGHSLLSISERYIATLNRNLDALEIGEDWFEIPDLLGFLQKEVTKSTIEAIMGSEILRLNPNLVADFWEFDYHVPNFIRGLPRWLVPGAFSVRERLLASIKKWHSFALQNSDCSKINPGDPEWDPYLGTKLVKSRLYHAINNKHTNADSRASEDVGLILAGNANVIPSLFWFIYEALKDRSLRDRLKEEIEPCLLKEQDLDILKVTNQPLLQSVFAETLRLRIAIAMSRMSEYSDYQLEKYTIPRNKPIVIFSRTGALNTEGWTNVGRPPIVPLERFWAERFLQKQAHSNVKPEKLPASSSSPNTKDSTIIVDDDSPGTFSIEGLAGCWLPFGGGQRMCPGRHLAKHEIIGTFAILFSKFDIEIRDMGAKEPVPDMRWYPVGALPPKEKFPIRIRKRC